MEVCNKSKTILESTDQDKSEKVGLAKTAVETLESAIQSWRTKYLLKSQQSMAQTQLDKIISNIDEIDKLIVSSQEKMNRHKTITVTRESSFHDVTLPVSQTLFDEMTNLARQITEEMKFLTRMQYTVDFSHSQTRQKYVNQLVEIAKKFCMKEIEDPGDQRNFLATITSMIHAGIQLNATERIVLRTGNTGGELQLAAVATAFVSSLFNVLFFLFEPFFLIKN